MEKFHKNMVRVTLTMDELWTILKLFRDGEEVTLTPDLEQKFIRAYHETKLPAGNAETLRQDNRPTLFSVRPAQYGIGKDFWELENFNQGLEEMRELKANLEAEEIEPGDIPLLARVEAVDLSIKAIEAVRQEFEKANAELPEAVLGAIETPPSNIIELVHEERAIYKAVKDAFQRLHEAYKADFERLLEENEAALPLGSTIEEGKVIAIKEILQIIDNLEAQFNMREQ